MELTELMKALAKKNISTSIRYDPEYNQAYLDLETNAKSHLYLYEDEILRGRYQYEKRIEIYFKTEDEIITELCREFIEALHGRGYYQSGWGEICKEKGMDLEIIYF